MAHMSVTFKGFDQLFEDFDRLDSQAARDSVDRALRATADYVQTNVNEAAQPYAQGGHKGYATGDMYNALRKENNVYWVTNYIAEVKLGFDFYADGGFHSIFMMYGTPKIAKDQKLYDAIFSSRTKKQVEKIQKEIMWTDFFKARGDI